MKQTEMYCADRVTTLYAAGDDADAFVVSEVTIEPVARKSESVDFQTIAWCPDGESADLILDALLMAAANKQVLQALELAEATIERLTRLDSAKRHSVQGTFDVIRTALKAAKGD